MQKRATKRPDHVKPPEHWVSVPLPAVQAKSLKETPEVNDPLGLNPVRYGDWALKGIAIDF
jgi:hypothetical protein